MTDLIKKYVPVSSSSSLHLFFLLLLLSFAGCKGTRSASTTASRTTDAAMAKAGIKLTNAEFTTAMFKGRGKFDQAGGNQSFGYRIHIKKDEMIWASISAFGIEGVRILARADSFFVLNRLKDEYYAGGYDYLEEKLGVKLDYQLLQDLLMGNAQLYREPTFPGNGVSFAFVDGDYTLNYFLDQQSQKPSKLEVVSQKQGKISELLYRSYGQSQGQAIPLELFFDVFFPKTTRVELQHKEAVLNATDLSFAFSIPDDFERVEPK